MFTSTHPNPYEYRISRVVPVVRRDRRFTKRHSVCFCAWSIGLFFSLVVHLCGFRRFVCVVHASFSRNKDSGTPRYGLRISYSNFIPTRVDISTHDPLISRLPILSLVDGYYKRSQSDPREGGMKGRGRRPGRMDGRTVRFVRRVLMLDENIRNETREIADSSTGIL